MIPYEKLKLIKENLEESLNTVMSGIYTQDMDTTKRVFEKECEIKNLIALVKDELAHFKNPIYIMFDNPSEHSDDISNIVIEKYKMVKSTLLEKSFIDSPMKRSRRQIYNIPKENVKFIYVKDMTDDEFKNLCKDLNSEIKIVDDENVMYTNYNDSCNITGKYYLIGEKI